MLSACQQEGPKRAWPKRLAAPGCPGRPARRACRLAGLAPTAPRRRGPRSSRSASTPGSSYLSLAPTTAPAAKPCHGCCSLTPSSCGCSRRSPGQTRSGAATAARVRPGPAPTRPVRTPSGPNHPAQPLLIARPCHAAERRSEATAVFVSARQLELAICRDPRIWGPLMQLEAQLRPAAAPTLPGQQLDGPPSSGDGDGAGRQPPEWPQPRLLHFCRQLLRHLSCEGLVPQVRMPTTAGTTPPSIMPPLAHSHLGSTKQGVAASVSPPPTHTPCAGHAWPPTLPCPPPRLPSPLHFEGRTPAACRLPSPPASRRPCWMAWRRRSGAWRPGWRPRHWEVAGPRRTRRRWR